MKAQVLPVLGHEVTHITGERLLAWRHLKHSMNIWFTFIRGMQNHKELKDFLQMGDEKLLFRGGVFTVVTPVCLMARWETRNSSLEVEYLQ